MFKVGQNIVYVDKRDDDFLYVYGNSIINENYPFDYLTYGKIYQVTDTHSKYPCMYYSAFDDREGMFFGVVFLWLMMIALEVFVFPVFAAKYGTFLTLIPIMILMIIIFPRYFSKRYNNWLESSINKNKK